MTEITRALKNSDTHVELSGRKNLVSWHPSTPIAVKDKILAHYQESEDNRK